ETSRHSPDVRTRVQALWSLVKLNTPNPKPLLEAATSDRSLEVRAEAARLLGEMYSDPGLESRVAELARKDASPFVRMQAILQLSSREALRPLVPVLADTDPFLAGAALTVLGRPGNSEFLLAHTRSPETKLRVGILLAIRKTGDAAARSQVVLQFLADADPA